MFDLARSAMDCSHVFDNCLTISLLEVLIIFLPKLFDTLIVLLKYFFKSQQLTTKA